MKKQALYWFIGGGVILSIITSWYAFPTKNHQTSVFSWFEEPLVDPKSSLNLLGQSDIDSLYQYFYVDDFDDPTKRQQLEKLLGHSKIAKKDVYLLNGEAEWALDAEATHLIQYIHKIHDFQSKQEDASFIRGIVIDIEPHTLDEFQNNSDAIMQSFTQGLKRAYQVAHGYDLKVIVCLPYYLDTEGYLTELETIIAEAADEVAIMNYYRGLEIEHIETEVALSVKYNKAIQTIYELQPAGSHGLTEMNTYHHLGLLAVSDNFEQLHAHYDYDIHLSYHEFNTLVELMK